MRVARYDDAASAALDEARRLSAFIIARFQDVVERRIAVSDGRPERVAETRSRGIGLHAITVEGWCGFASSDDCTPSSVRELVRRAAALARVSGKYSPEVTSALSALNGQGRLDLSTRPPKLASTSFQALIPALADANQRLLAMEGGAVRTSLVAVDDEWRIVRSDGADVSFPLPRASIRHDITIRADDGVTSMAAVVGGEDAGQLCADRGIERLQRRARRSIANARFVMGAPAVRASPFRVAIDHALAKGLAHEAIGHASETDVAGISFLANADGRLRIGDRYAPPNVSIVDGPLEADFANQPISANGLERQTVHVIRSGVLESGIGDLFSAQKADSPMTGACRAGTYRQRPTPRMTNIRLVLSDPLPYVGDPETIDPEEALENLHAAGLCGARSPVLLMLGYRGGQAHPVRGDFIFTSVATFELTDRVEPRQPAVLSGRSESALGSIIAGLGDLRLDATGICGKNGQNVPSSGGSHRLVVLDSHTDLLVGTDR